MLRVKVFFVGGVLRDGAMGRPIADIDLAVPSGAFDFAQALAVQADATFVSLDEVHGSARVVFADGSSMDITDFRRKSIEEDCRARDITINSLAAQVEPFFSKGSKALIDPGRAIEDILKERIRPCGETSFSEDPLRILRAFRYAAILKFSLTPEALSLAQQHAPMLSEIAAERVFYEFIQIFRSRRARTVLPAMHKTGVLSTLFPFYTAKDISAWIGRASFIENALKRTSSLPGLDAAREDMRNFLVLTMLAAGKPGPRITDLIVALRLGKGITGRVMRVQMALVSVRRLVKDHPIEEDFLYITARIFLSLGKERLAPWLIMAADEDEEAIFRTLEKAEQLTINKIKPIVESPAPVTGGELVKALDKAPGPWVSEALERIFFRRLTGKVTDADSAIAFVRELEKNGEL